MAMEIRGGNIQVGTTNSQSITNHFSISIHTNCTECKQHQHQEGVQISQENEHHVINFLQRSLASGAQSAQISTESTMQDEAAVKSQIEPAIPAKSKVVKKRRVKVTGPDQQTLEPSLTATSAVTDSVRILDSSGQVLEPGDAVVIGSGLSGALSLYVGDGYIVQYQKQSGTVVKETLDLTEPFYKDMILNDGNLKVYSPKERVQRALQQVGRPCPVQGGSGLDFVYWLFTGQDYEQIAVTDSVRILDSSGQVLEPGDAVVIGSGLSGALSLYVGDGYIVQYQEQSGTVVKETLDLTEPFYKDIIFHDSNLKVYSRKERVQRALQQVGRPCPVQGGSGLDFVYWLFTGQDYEQIG